MKRSMWVRLIAVILIISMLAVPVSAAAYGGPAHSSNGLIGAIIGLIRDIIRGIFDDWFDQPVIPGPTVPVEPTNPPVPTTPVEPTVPTEPGETEPGETPDPTEPGETEPAEPTEPELDSPEYELNLVEGHKNTENGQLLRGVTYTLNTLIPTNPATAPLTMGNMTMGLNPLGNVSMGANALGNSAALFGLKTMAAVPAVQPMADGDAESVVYQASESAVTDLGLTNVGDSAMFVIVSNTSGKEMVANVGTNSNSQTGFELADRSDANDVAANAVWTITKVETGYTVSNGGLNVAVKADHQVALEAGAVVQIQAGNSTGDWVIHSDGWCLNDHDSFSGAFDDTSGTSNALSTYTNLAGGRSMLNLYSVTKLVTEPEEPEEPSQPETVAELIYFPVTMFNYDGATINSFTDAMDTNGTTVREGFYFSNGGSELGSVSYETDDDLSAFVAGQYYIQNIRASNNNVNSWLQAHADNKIYAVAQADATLWTLVIENDQYYLTCDIDGTTNYLKVGTSGTTDGYTTEKTPVSLVAYSHNTEGVQIKQGSYYLCQWGGDTALDFGGYDTNNDTGNGMRFYAVNDGVVADAPTTISSVTTDEIIAGYEKWNWWGYLSSGHSAQNMFYGGLVEDELDENNEIVFTVNEPGIFTYDASAPTVTNDGKKDIYQNVGLPFVLNEKGYYTFDSDVHGTYFADTTGDDVSDPWYGASDDYFNMFFDYENTQGWSGMYYGDGSTNLWAPFNTNTNDTGESAIDYHLGMRADIPFSMTPNGRIKSTDDNSEPITFTFAGDDDVWIFIDGKLVIDLGGIHNRIGATINFADNTITYFRPESNSKDLPIGSYTNPDQYPLNDDGTITVKLYDDTNGDGALGQTRPVFSSEEEHIMSIFYLERGKGTSNCKIEFNLPMRDTVLITKDATKSWSEKQDEADRENGDGTVSLTAKEQAAVDKLNFGFTLYKKTAEETEFTAVKNTNFYVQDKDGNVLAIQSTDGNGKFYLKNGQTAKFMTDIPKEGITYYVVEDTVPEGFLTPDYSYAGLATWGYDYTGEAILTDKNGDYILDDDGNLTSGTVSGTVTNAADMGEHELPLDAAENKSYEVTVKGSIESIDSIEFICTNYLDADLPNPSALANEDIIVIDYGLPVQIDPLANDLFRGDEIEIVAWGDESLTLNEVLDDYGNAIDDQTTWTGNELTNVLGASLGSDANYNGDVIDVTDCLFTFTKNADGTWVVSSADANGNSVYLQPYASNNGYPVVSESQNITIGAGSTENTVTLSNTSGYLFFWRDGKNYYDRVDKTTGFESGVSFFLYAEQEDGSYGPIAGKDAIVSGEKYLIVADAGDNGKFVTYPTTSNANGKYTQIAKLVTLENSRVFDFGNVTFNDVTYSDTTRDTFEYTLTEQLTEVEVISYIVKVTSTIDNVVDGEVIEKSASRYCLAKVYIVPATIMYYEENFSDLVTFVGKGWNGGSTTANSGNVSAYQEPGVVGTIDDSTYGSDVAYLRDNGDSNGTYRFGDTTNGAIRFTYTFTGTGTSIFARTSALTGYMQVKIYEDTDTSGECLDVYYRDTYWQDTNGTDLDSDGTLYNIPVYTNEDLDYGTYTVVCTVAKKGTLGAGATQPLKKMTAHTCYDENGSEIEVAANTADHQCRDEKGRLLEAMQSGGEFYLDGIRIMQPLNEYADDQDLVEKALGAYATDGEANLDVVTLRQKLITDVQDGEATWDGTNFVVLTDTLGNITTADEYISFGPKEEVYLAPGQKVTFSLKYWQPEGLKLYMGMKAPFGGAKVNIGHDTYELNNAPDCYYDVTDNYASLVTVTEEDGYESYIVTYTFEAKESIVSLTNIKVVGSYEFVIIENTDLDLPDDNGGND